MADEQINIDVPVDIASIGWATVVVDGDKCADDCFWLTGWCQLFDEFVCSDSGCRRCQQCLDGQKGNDNEWRKV